MILLDLAAIVQVLAAGGMAWLAARRGADYRHRLGYAMLAIAFLIRGINIEMFYSPDNIFAKLYLMVSALMMVGVVLLIIGRGARA